MNNGAAGDATRTIGLRLRRIRKARGKSLEVISGLAGMSTSTLHHIEYGRRELNLPEIVALARALKIDPAKLIILPIPAPPKDTPTPPSEQLKPRPQSCPVWRRESRGACDVSDRQEFHL